MNAIPVERTGAQMTATERRNALRRMIGAALNCPSRLAPYYDRPSKASVLHNTDLTGWRFFGRAPEAFILASWHLGNSGPVKQLHIGGRC